MKSLWNWILALFGKTEKGKSAGKLDRSGIVFSTYHGDGGEPSAALGWLKGWVVNVLPRDIIIVARHANADSSGPNSVVFVTDSAGQRIERRIVAVNREPLPTGYKTRSGEMAPDMARLEGDVCICRVDRPFPDTVRGYDFATHLADRQDTVLFDQDGKRSSASIRIMDQGIAWLRGTGRSPALRPGDSGTPWFVQEDGMWKVASHTAMGDWGEGPWYGHSRIYSAIRQRIAALR